MSQSQQAGPHTYTQGHSDSTIATHLRRTAEVEAAFLLPHIKKTDHILDVGCGPGTITLGFAKYASEGKVFGVDIAPAVLEKARSLAADANVSTEGPGSVAFSEGNVLDKLDFLDESFDIVYCSQVFGHLPAPEAPLKALAEIRRLLKPGGILATRDGTGQQFFPRSCKINRLWNDNFRHVLTGGRGDEDSTETMMLGLFRKAGFDVDSGKVILGASTMTVSTPEGRRWMASRAAGQLKPGDGFYKSWLDAGISEAEIQETVAAAYAWAETQDAWLGSIQCEMLAWK